MDGLIGEIRVFALSYVPQGWLACDGSGVPVSQYNALYAIIGNTFGGNTTTFNLPNLKGYITNSAGLLPGGNLYPFGATAGVENVSIDMNSMPAHNHSLTGAFATTNPIAQEVQGPASNAYLSNIVAQDTNKGGRGYTAYNAATNVPLNPMSISMAGQGAAHTNMAPYLPLIFAICYDGTFPPRP